jgi:D-threonate/D-erythronate kinase
MVQQIIVIADDLSGAAELAGIAFLGCSAEVQRHFDPSSDASLLAVDTDSRNLPPPAAAERVRMLAEQIWAVQPEWIFKKVDSLLRGNVRAEIEALLRVAGQPRAVLIPANPSRGRVIRGGQYLVDGVPLDQTPLAADPFQPRGTAAVEALLGGDGDYPLRIIAADAPLPDRGIIVPDVASAADVARRAAEIDDGTLAAGAADFFAILLRDRCPGQSVAHHACIGDRELEFAPPALLVCGSRVSWPSRVQDCAAAGIGTVSIDDVRATPNSFGALLLGIGDARIDRPQTAILSQLAEVAAQVIDQAGVKTLMAEGGATAAAIAQRLGWNRLRVVAASPFGIGTLRPIGVQWPLLHIKPGSYHWPRELWRLFLACHRK